MEEITREDSALRRARLEKGLPISVVADHFNMTLEECTHIEEHGGPRFWEMVRFCLVYEDKPLNLTAYKSSDEGFNRLINALCFDSVRVLKKQIQAYKKAKAKGNDFKMALALKEAMFEINWIKDEPYMDSLGIDPIEALQSIFESEGVADEQVFQIN